MGARGGGSWIIPTGETRILLFVVVATQLRGNSKGIDICSLF